MSPISSGERSTKSPTTVGANALPAQMMRQLVCVRVELGVAQPPVLEHHRGRSRRAPRLRGKQRGQRRRRNRARGVVPHRHDGGALRRRQNIEPADRTIRGGNRARQQTQQPLPQHRDACALKAVRPVVEPQPQLPLR